MKVYGILICCGQLEPVKLLSISVVVSIPSRQEMKTLRPVVAHSLTESYRLAVAAFEH